MSKIQPLTPSALDGAIRTCLAKDPEERWQTARDLLLELKWIAQAVPQAGAPAPAASRRSVRERAAWTAAALGIALAVVATTGWWLTPRASPPRPLMRLS